MPTGLNTCGHITRCAACGLLSFQSFIPAHVPPSNNCLRPTLDDGTYAWENINQPPSLFIGNPPEFRRFRELIKTACRVKCQARIDSVDRHFQGTEKAAILAQLLLDEDYKLNDLFTDWGMPKWRTKKPIGWL